MSDEFERVGGPRKYYKYNDCEVGQVLVVGEYTAEVPNKFGKVNWEFKDDDGNIVSLNYSGQLAYIMADIHPGDRVKVIYDGKVLLEKGSFKGKEAHQFDVRRARKNSPRVVEAEVVSKDDVTEVGLEDLS